MAAKKKTTKTAPSSKKVPEPSKLKHRLTVLLPWALALFFGVWALYPTIQEAIVEPAKEFADDMSESRQTQTSPAETQEMPSAVPKRDYLDFHERLKSQQVVIDTEELNQNFDPDKQYMLQVGAFGKREVAETEKARFALQGYSVWMERSGRYYVLKSGPYTGKREARKYRTRFRKMGADVMTLEYKPPQEDVAPTPAKPAQVSPSPVQSATDSGRQYRLQIASFSSLDDAEKRRAELILQGIETQILAAKVNQKSVFRLQTPSMNENQARKLQKSLQNQQIDTLFVRE